MLTLIHETQDTQERKLIFKALELAVMHIDQNIEWDCMGDEGDFVLMDYLQEAADEWLDSKRSICLESW